jgi:hypothetical protein
MINKDEFLKYFDTNNRWIKRYLNFIEAFEIKNDEITYEKHHILPKSLFPNFKNDEWNKINLSLRSHFIAHYMLAKALDGKMWYAFNIMSNRYQHKKSITYELGKINFLSTIVQNMTGRSHSLSTKEKMSKNGIKGKTAYYDSDNNVKYFKNKPDELIWSKGNPNSRQSKNYLRDKKWVTLLDGTFTRMSPDEIEKSTNIESVTRKFNNVGFEKINNGNLIKAFNLYLWKYEMIEKNIFEQNDYYVLCGQSASKIVIYGFENKIFSSASKFGKFLANLEYYCPTKSQILNNDVITYHHNLKNTKNLDFKTPIQELGYFIITENNFKKIKQEQYIINQKEKE